MLDIGQALLTAIGYEKRVLASYSKAREDAPEGTARRVYGLLAREERDHVLYLEGKLAAWRANGVLEAPVMASNVPSIERIREGAASLARIERREPAQGEVEALKRAIELEAETSAFYERLVDELDGDGKRFFARFSQIEAGHLALVEAELGAVQGSGHWFDMPEFSLEAE